MIDVRCKNCNRMLAKANVVVGAIKCPSCKMIFEYRVYDDIYDSSTYDPKSIDTLRRGGIMESEPQSS